MCPVGHTIILLTEPTKPTFYSIGTQIIYR